MAKLVKIKDVHLYLGLTDTIADSYEAFKLLKASGVKFNLLNFNDQEAHHENNYAAISTWVLGRDNHQKTIKDYPILTWDECWDDWTTTRRVAHGLQEVKDSDVLKFPELQLKQNQ